MSGIRKLGERHIEVFPVWVLRLTVILLIMLLSVQAGIYKGRRMERESKTATEGVETMPQDDTLQENGFKCGPGAF